MANRPTNTGRKPNEAEAKKEAQAMNHRQKVVEAIKRRAECYWDVQQAASELTFAKKSAHEADKDLVRQIKNVLGHDRIVLHEDWTYEISDNDELIARPSGLIVLTDG